MARFYQNPRKLAWCGLHLILVLVGYILCLAPNRLGDPAQEAGQSTLFGPLLFAIGSSVIASGIAGLMIYAYISLSEDLSEQVAIISKFGIASVFDARSVRIRHEYDARLSKAKEGIDVLGFGLSSLRHDYLAEFQNWKHRANVRILLLDPEFPSTEQSCASQRDLEERNTVGKIAQDVQKFIDEVCPLIGVAGQHTFDIRLYTCIPTLNIFRIDDHLFWGPYLLDEESRNHPTFLVTRGGTLYARFSRQFDLIWTKYSRPIPEQWRRKTAG